MYEGPRYKVVVLGDGGVGKTAILERYIEEKFSSTYKLTIGANILIKEVNHDKLGQFKFQFWDMAGQKRFDLVRSSYYRGAHAAILVFDLNWPASFNNLITWKEELITYVNRQIPIVLVGNKSDLLDKVPLEEVQEFVDLMNESLSEINLEMPYCKVSAKLGDNIDEIFENHLCNVITEFRENQF